MLDGEQLDRAPAVARGEVLSTEASHRHLRAGLQVHAQITSSIWHV